MKAEADREKNEILVPALAVPAVLCVQTLCLKIKLGNTIIPEAVAKVAFAAAIATVAVVAEVVLAVAEATVMMEAPRIVIITAAMAQMKMIAIAIWTF